MLGATNLTSSGKASTLLLAPGSQLPALSYLFTMPTCLPAPIAWTPNHGVRILDQTLLPMEEAYRDLETCEAVAEAIRTLRVRGAPLIGIAAAMGVVVGQRGGEAARQGLASIHQACEVLG